MACRSDRNVTKERKRPDRGHTSRLPAVGWAGELLSKQASVAVWARGFSGKLDDAAIREHTKVYSSVKSFSLIICTRGNTLIAEIHSLCSREAKIGFHKEASGSAGQAESQAQCRSGADLDGRSSISWARPCVNPYCQ
jgi:hypothetical protein